MSNVKDFLLDAGILGGSGKIINPEYGGMQGISPVIGMILNGENVNSLNSNQAYVSGNVIPFLLQAPGFFKYLKDGKKLVRMLKSTIETHSSIEGLDSSLTVESVSSKAGGNEDQEQPSKTIRAQSKPVHTMTDKDGKPIQKLYELWIRMGIGSEDDDNVPLVTRLATYDAEFYDMSMYTMTVMYVEPDKSHKRVTNCWLCTNMYPKGAGSNVGKRDLTAPGELLTLGIEFSAVTIPYNITAARELAEKLLTDMRKVTRNYSEHPIFLKNKDANLNETNAPIGVKSTARG